MDGEHGVLEAVTLALERAAEAIDVEADGHGLKDIGV
jgi:hypothetical protein